MKAVGLGLSLLLTSVTFGLAEDKPKPAAAAAEAVVEAAQKAVEAATAEQELVKEGVSALIEGVLNLFGGGGAAVPAQLILGDGDLPAGGDQLEQQFAPQLKPLVKAELSLIQRVFEPTKEQQKELKKVGEKGLKIAVKKLADVQRKMQQGGWQVPTDGSSIYPDPRKPIQETFTETLKAMFPAEKLATYEAEMVKRGEARKRVALLNLVAKIDKDMVLSKDQREKISESLKTNWKSGWDQSLEMFMHGDENVPRPADEMVVPFLNETQKQAWRDSNTGQNQFWGWGGWGGFGVLVEDDAVGN